MKKNITVILFLSLIVNSLYAQNTIEKDVLFTINNEKIYVSEFLESYNRNIDLIQDPEQKKLDYNIDLYKKYRAKLQQAHVLGLDTLAEYKKEIATYRKQLSEPYFNDPIEEEKLVKEAYERSKEELNVSHILILLKEDASEKEKKETIAKLNAIKKDIISGKSTFEQQAKQYSEDPSAKNNSGNLNWMGVFYMVYPFESAAYSLNVGEISDPIRTSFGYHLVKLNEKRESLGKVQVAHIIKYYLPGKNKDSLDIANKALLDTVKLKLEGGEEFADLARRYSDDKRSAMNGGNIQALGAGKLLPEMEEVAFSLKEGEVSKPFKSNYGWHLLKLNTKIVIKSYEDSKDELLKQIRRDRRYNKIEKSILEHLKLKYSYKVYDKTFKGFESKINSGNFTQISSVSIDNSNSKVLKIEDKSYDLSRYKEYLVKNPIDAKNQLSLNYTLKIKREEFINSMILEYYDENLEKEYPEFNSLLNNYKEGILVYNLMNEKIWIKSHTDTIGIKKFYEENKNNYMWPERADLLIAKCFKEKDSKKVRKYMKRGWSKEKIEAKLNKASDVKVTFQSGIVTKNNKAIPENFEWDLGVSEIYKKSDSYFVIVDVIAYVKPEIKTFEEAENEIRSDYQNYLEKAWEKELTSDYNAKVDQDVYNKLNETIK